MIELAGPDTAFKQPIEFELDQSELVAAADIELPGSFDEEIV